MIYLTSKQNYFGYHHFFYDIINTKFIYSISSYTECDDMTFYYSYLEYDDVSLINHIMDFPDNTFKFSILPGEFKISISDEDAYSMCERILLNKILNTL